MSEIEATEASRTGGGSDRSEAWFAALLVALTALAYAHVLGAGFVWDDAQYLVENDTLRGVEGLWRIWIEPRSNSQYYPLVFTTFWIEHALWGLRPLGYHVVNVLLHAANAILVLALFRRLALPGAWLAALLFALHPLQVESVAWVSERKNVLSGLLYLASALAYLRFRGLGADPPASIGRHFAGALLLFAGALLSKSVTASLPAAILLVLYWKTGTVRRRDVLLLAPFFALGIAAGLHTAWLERIHVGASGAEWDLGVVERVLIASRALCHYVAKFVWPHPLVFSYPRWEIDAGSVWQYAFVLAVLAMLAWAWRARHVTRGPLAALLFFAGTLAPALGFLDVYPMRFSFVADHFQYLAILGLIAPSAAGIAAAGRTAGSALAVGWVALLAVLTFAHVPVFRDEETLWHHTLAENPDSFLAHNNLGRVYGLRGEHERALPHFRRTIEILPTDYIAETNLAEALNRLGRYEEAIPHLRNVIAQEPRYADAHFFLWAALHETGRVDEAVMHLRREAELKATYGAHLQAARTLRRAGRPRDALVEVARAEQRRTGSAVTASLAGDLHAELGDWERAALAYGEAIRRNPYRAADHARLGRAQEALGRPAEAEQSYQRALEIEPNLPAARSGLARLRAGGAAAPDPS